jgi:Ca2+-binding RTX toxin-like protein
MDGGRGSDTYVFDKGDGQDTIYNYKWNSNDVDTIQFGEGITNDDVEFVKDGYDLVIKVKDTDDSIRVKYWFYGDWYRVDKIRFSDGTELTKSDIEQIGYKVYGTSGNDTLYGSNSSDIMYGQDGDDTLYANAGNDTLIGGVGNDKLYGGDGNDVLIGGPGNDYIDGSYGSNTYIFNKGDGQDTIYNYKWNSTDVDTIQFGEGVTKEDLEFIKEGDDLVIKVKDTNDSIRVKYWFYEDLFKVDRIKFADGTEVTKQYIDNLRYVIYGTLGDDKLYGSNGDDILIGGPGNDYMNGGPGSDTYIFNKGDGNDIIYGDNLDILKFGEGITEEDLQFSRNGNDLVIWIKNSDDSITLENWFKSKDFKIGKIEFIDGSILTNEEVDSIIDFFTIKGTDKDDVLYGTEENDTIIGLDGNDTIYGGNGDDILIGGPGDDYLEGGYGNDTYIFNKGDGNDTIYINKTDKYQAPWGSWIFTEKAKLVFGDGITKDDLDFIKENNDLIIKIQNNNDSIRIKDYFTTTRWIGWWRFYPVNHKIDEIVFSDGTKLSSKEIEYHGFKVIGTSEDDYLAGYIGNDILIGYEGDDTLFANVGDDILIGGPGNDWLYGDDGSDTYIFNKGDGQDEIYETWYDDPNKIDKIKFGERITKDDVVFRRDGEDLIVEIKNSSDRIIIFNQFDGSEGSPKIDIFEFSDGTILTKDDVNNLEDIKLLKGTEGDDNIYGSYLDELIYGYGGNDYIYGEGGNDFIDAGDGDDYIYVQDGNSLIVGGKGNDYIELSGDGEKIIEFNGGDGVDTVYPPHWGDWSLKVRFGEGITKDDINYQFKNGGLFLELNNTEEGILIVLPMWNVYSIDYYYEYEIGDYGLFDYGALNWDEIYTLAERISLEFQDRTVVSGSEIIESNFSIIGTDEGDNLYGTQKSDILIGKKGNDYLNGGSGSDVYIFNPGDGQDIIEDRENEGILSEDVLKFKTDKENIALFKDNDDLIIGYSNNDFVKVLDQFKDENSGIEKIEVKDGYYITRWDIENIVNAMIDFTNDKGMSYAEIYNNLLNNQNFNMLLSQSWSKSWVGSMCSIY